MQKTVAATAVAGPRTLNNGSTVCNVAPMMVCGNSGAPGMWGYTLNEPAVLKKSTPGGQSQVGPGNFQLIQLGGSWRGHRAREHGGQLQRLHRRRQHDPDADRQRGRTGGARAEHAVRRVQRPDERDAGDLSARCHRRRAIAGAGRRAAQRRPAQGYDVYQGGTHITHENIDQLYNYQDYSADLANPVDLRLPAHDGRRHRGVRATRGGRSGRRLHRHGERSGLGVRCSASRASSCCSQRSSKATTRSSTASSSRAAK